MKPAMQITDALGWSLLHFLWQGALIAAALALLLQLCRNARPQTRYLLAAGALLLCLLLPLLQFTSLLNESGPAAADAALPVIAGSSALQGTSFGALLQAGLQACLPQLVALWGMCVALLGLRMGMGLLWVYRHTAANYGHSNAEWQRRTDLLAASLQLRRAVRLTVVGDLQTPLTAGCWRPVVLLPLALLSGMPPELLEALLAHELAHIKRHDYLFNLLQNCIVMLLFYHPAVWWISAQIRIEREQIADDLAARTLGEPRRLALALQQLETFQSLNPQLALAAHGGILMSRIKRLLRPQVQVPNWKAGLLTLALAAASITLGAHAVTPERKPVAKLAAASKPANTEKAIIDFNVPSCKPEYPRQSLRREEAGTVQLAVYVGADGRVAKVRIERSSGFPALDNAVADKLMAGCQSQAKLVNGKGIADWVKVQYVWKLQ